MVLNAKYIVQSIWYRIRMQCIHTTQILGQNMQSMGQLVVTCIRHSWCQHTIHWTQTLLFQRAYTRMPVVGRGRTKGAAMQMPARYAPHSEREGSASCNLRIFCISNKYSLYVIAFCVQLCDKRKRCIESNKLASLEARLVWNYDWPTGWQG